MAKTTVIRDARWTIFWNGKEHVYLCGADVAFTPPLITHVGPHYSGPADREIDGSDRLVMPGLINVHAHMATEPVNKGFRDEVRSPSFWHSPLYEHLYMIEVGAKEALTTVQVAVGELLLSGVTTGVHLGQLQLGVDSGALYDMLARTGMRIYLGPMFRDARWSTRNGHAVEYVWDVDAGRRDFEKAVLTIEKAQQHPSKRLFGMVCPGQIDTCTSDTIQKAHALAADHDVPLQIHIAQSPNEFHEVVRRTGLTPVAYLSSLGALDHRTVLGHAVFLDHHPWLHWSSRRDLDLVTERGASVAHCPVEFIRRGMALRTLGTYIRKGINVGIGTDTYPHNMLEELRMAAYAARIVGESVDDVTTSEVFQAATVGGARALLRDDIGRLAPGCRADIVLVDLKQRSMMPVREPLRSLIYCGAERAVRDVFVDGEQVVVDGCLAHIDLDSALAEVEAIQERGSKNIKNRDWAGRDLHTLAPMALSIDQSKSVTRPRD